MAIIFDINERGELMVDAKTLTVEAFYQLYKSDKAPNKLNAIKLLKYVFFMGDITEKNPHRDIAYHLRESYAKKDVFGDANHKFSKKEQEMIENAIQWYYTLNRDCVDRLALAVNKQVDQITKLLEDSEEITVKNYRDRVELLKDIKNILISKTQTDDFVEKTKKKAKTKGNAARSPMEMGLILTQSNDDEELE
ncbi:hypothetical protein [Mongoliitalea daihaiensis]|uniref:hypothetical protein n=1 Tax=Mongoliitalea daihaiensis TaxID=2782006 RepID=UPI001F38735A|nr:hypothetical protein [Mongoliitalea daihaiensis]UJP64009.1 hypothetical protein IPZ59_14420 [Mongoliitalea daihaiensis]